MKSDREEVQIEYIILREFSYSYKCPDRLHIISADQSTFCYL